MTELSKEFVQTLRRLIYAPIEVRRELQAQGVNIIPSNFYSNIPTVEEIEGSFEYLSDEEIYNTGIFDREKIRQFVVDTLSRYSHEFLPADGRRPQESFGVLLEGTGFLIRRCDGLLLHDSTFQAESSAGGRVRLLHVDCR